MRSSKSWQRNNQSRTEFLMPPNPSTNFEIQKYQNKCKLNGVYSRNTFPKVKGVAYVINLDECKSIRAHQIALYVNSDNVTYFDSFGVEYIPKRIKEIHRQTKMSQQRLINFNQIIQ